ncbi:hypothetical protein [Streptomyces sp. NPDC059651]|uniref:hypothetical protein n=1 Tax=unclassified Streptomyces TaxID=2593676 RepID=UPI0036A10B0F
MPPTDTWGGEPGPLSEAIPAAQLRGWDVGLILTPSARYLTEDVEGADDTPQASAVLASLVKGAV